jgi:hypothetical protein
MSYDVLAKHLNVAAGRERRSYLPLILTCFEQPTTLTSSQTPIRLTTSHNVTFLCPVECTRRHLGRLLSIERIPYATSSLKTLTDSNRTGQLLQTRIIRSG